MNDFEEWIERNKEDIDYHIRAVLNKPEYKITPAERRQWILNDESLYAEAMSAGISEDEIVG